MLNKDAADTEHHTPESSKTPPTMLTLISGTLVGGANYSDIYDNEMNTPIQSRNNTTNNNQLNVPTLPEIARKVSKLEKTQLDEKQYITYEIIVCTFLLGLVKDGNNPKTTLYSSLQQSMGCLNTTDMEDLVNSDETRGYQLCHFDVVAIQLAALGCNRLVGPGSNPACNSLALAPSSATVYSAVPALGTGFDSWNGPCVSTCMWGSPYGGGSVHHTLPYALTCEPALYTFDETHGYQLCHYDVVVAQLVATCFIKQVKGKRRSGPTIDVPHRTSWIR